MKGTIRRLRDDGRQEVIEYRADFDHEYPVMGTEAYDTIRLKRIDAHTAEAGPHFRWPWPIQSVHKFDQRIHSYESKFEQVLTADVNNLLLSVYVGWKISDPTVFLTRFNGDVHKAEAKGRTRQELDEVICWLTGYSPKALAEQIDRKVDIETFFGEAPALHPYASKITGVICGVRIEEIEDPLMRKIRYLDKLVDELAKGRPMEKILRK